MSNQLKKRRIDLSIKLIIYLLLTCKINPPPTKVEDIHEIDYSC